jgi:regulator of protease activity HflC (stomatin/prohibitin superfamily)
VEVRDVILPDSMKRAMAGQAESERERRAKIINAEGEFQAAEKLVQAANAAFVGRILGSVALTDAAQSAFSPALFSWISIALRCEEGRSAPC